MYASLTLSQTHKFDIIPSFFSSLPFFVCVRIRNLPKKKAQRLVAKINLDEILKFGRKIHKTASGIFKNLCNIFLEKSTSWKKKGDENSQKRSKCKCKCKSKGKSKNTQT